MQLIAYKYLLGIRMTLEDELAGADFVEHGIVDKNPKEGTHAFGAHLTIKQDETPQGIEKIEDPSEVVVNPQNGSVEMRVNGKSEKTTL